MSGFTKGTLSEAFGSSVAKAGAGPALDTLALDGDKQAAETIKKLNLSQREDGLADAGLMETAQGAAQSHLKDQDREKKKLREVQERLQRAIQDNIRRLNEIAEWHEAKAEEFEEKAAGLRDRIAGNIGRMSENSAFLGETEKVLQAYENGEEVDSQSIRALLKKRGAEAVEEVPLVLLIQQLETERDAMNAENARLDEENEGLESKAQDCEAKAEEHIEQVKEIRQRIEDIPAHLSDDEKERLTSEILKEASEEVQYKYYDLYNSSAELEKADEEKYESKMETIEKTVSQEKTPSISEPHSEQNTIADFNPLGGMGVS